MEVLNTSENKQLPWAWRVVKIVLTLWFFLFSIKLMVASLGGFADGLQENILSSALNPFVGLFIGLLVTAMIQSSSTISTMVVAMVATGTLSIEEAVPIIMGANIGTTLTSTIVSLGFISNKKAFRKAVSTGVIHDLYNIMLVVVLFPLEYYYKILSRASVGLSQFIGVGSEPKSNGGLKEVLDLGAIAKIQQVVSNNIVLLIIAIAFLFLSIKLLTNTIRKTVIGNSKNRLRRFVFDKPFKSFGWGVLITSAIQSSSVSTSLLVPLAAAEKIRLANAFPFIIGANLGTTLTALLAASFSSEAAISIAIAHLLFNLNGAIIFMLSAKLRTALVSFTKKLSVTMTQRRVIGLAYILVTFFLLPFLLISLHQNTSSDKGERAMNSDKNLIEVTTD